MRRCVYLLALSLAAASPTMGLADAGSWVKIASSETISPEEAAGYVGQTATVVGIVSQVSRDQRSGNIFLNFGDRYPNHAFYAVIFDYDAGMFSGVERLEGSSVAITGTVQLYRGKPQIIVSDPAQLESR